MPLPKAPLGPAHSGKPPTVFSTTQAARLLGVSPAEIRRLLWVTKLPVRKEHGRLLLGFRDLVVLRSALHLRQQSVPLRRLAGALRKLHEQVPDDTSVSAVRLWAKGNQVFAQSGRSFWAVESGQLVFPFAVGCPAETKRGLVRDLSQVKRTPPVEDTGRAADSAEHWLSLAIAREEAGDIPGARLAYSMALREDENLPDACVNLGRLAHQEGQFEEAVRWYRRALRSDPDDAIAHYDLAIALEDLGDFREAVREYQRALKAKWDFPEAHFNLSRLYRAMGQTLAAARHLRIYHRLTGRRD